MFKKLLQLKTLLVALLVMTGAGNVWGEQAILPNTQALTTEFANVGVDSKIQIKTSSANSYTNPLRFYANNTITIKAVEGYVINSVIYEASSTGNYVTNAQNATVTPEVTPTVSGKNVTWTLTNATEFTFKPSAQTRANSIKINYSASSSSCKTPTFSPAAGTYTSAQDVTISTTTDGATIYYTIDGTNPTTSSSVYTEAIPVSTTTTIKAMAAKEGMTNSSVATAVYTIQYPLSSIALSGTYPTTFSEGAAFSHEGMTVTATYSNESTKDVTSDATFSGYDMDTPGNQTVTVSYTEGDVKETATYNITVNAVPSHNVTWSVNGETTVESCKEGASISFPANPADVNGKTFVGWVTDAIEGTTDTAPSFVTSATMGSSDVTYYAVFAKREGGVNSVTDELDRAFTGVTETSYTNWSDKTDNSAAVYAGNSAGGNNSIQLRSKNNESGIVTTTSGGTLSKVTVTWNSNTSASRTLNVYGSNTAYEAAADLYDSSKQGTLLGTIAYGTSTELTVSGDYAYVGLRSAESAMYLDQVDITWSVSSNTYSAYCTSVAPKTPTTLTIDAKGLTNTDVYVSTAAGALAATVRPQESDEPVEDVTVTWTSSNTDVATIAADGTVTLVAAGTTILTATYAGDDTYAYSNNTYELTVTDSNPIRSATFTFNGQYSDENITNGITNSIVHFICGGDDNRFAISTAANYKDQLAIYKKTENTTNAGCFTISSTDDNYAIVRIELDGTNTGSLSTDVSSYDNSIWQGNSSSVTFTNNTTGTQCYISDITVFYTRVTPLFVSAAGYATFSSTSALDFTNVEDICAYTATVSGETISFKRVNKVPANTGLLLRSVNGGAVEEAVPSLTGAADDVAGNLFVAVSEDTSLASDDESNNNYILNNGSNGIGFYLANNKTVGAGKAYLAVPKTAGVRGFISFDFSDPATGIATIGGNAIEGTAFDLQGRRVSMPKNGLYIINGKKVIVK